QRPQVVAVRPPQWGARHHSVTVREPRAGNLQPLNEPWNVDVGRELENQVHVISHDPELHQSSPVTQGDLRKHTTQERRRSGVDQGQPAQRGPGQEGVEMDGHRSSLWSMVASSGIILIRRGSFVRALRGRARPGVRPYRAHNNAEPGLSARGHDNDTRVSSLVRALRGRARPEVRPYRAHTTPSPGSQPADTTTTRV